MANTSNDLIAASPPMFAGTDSYAVRYGDFIALVAHEYPEAALPGERVGQADEYGRFSCLPTNLKLPVA